MEARRDSNKSRLKTKSEKPVRKLLKKGAVPSKFSNVPSYLQSKAVSTPRQTKKSTSSSRQKDEAKRLEELEVTFTASDDISQLSHPDIAQSLKSESTVPEGFVVSEFDDSLLVYLMQMLNDVPRIVACICLKQDMSVVCSLDEKLVPESHYSDLLTNRRVTKLSQLINLMARVKAWQVDSSSKPLSLYVQMAVSVLKGALDNISDRNSEEFRKNLRCFNVCASCSAGTMALMFSPS